MDTCAAVAAFVSAVEYTTEDINMISARCSSLPMPRIQTPPITADRPIHSTKQWRLCESFPTIRAGCVRLGHVSLQDEEPVSASQYIGTFDCHRMRHFTAEDPGLGCGVESFNRICLAFFIGERTAKDEDLPLE